MASLRFASILSSNYYKSLENSLPGEFLMRDNFNVMQRPDGHARVLLPSAPPSPLLIPFLLSLLYFSSSLPQPFCLPSSAQQHQHMWLLPSPGSASPQGTRLGACIPPKLSHPHPHPCKSNSSCGLCLARGDGWLLHAIHFISLFSGHSLMDGEGGNRWIFGGEHTCCQLSLLIPRSRGLVLALSLLNIH